MEIYISDQRLSAEKIVSTIHAPVTLPQYAPGPRRADLYLRFIKKPIDMLLAGLLIAGVLSWLTPLLFILYRITGSGRLFYTQKRIGRDNRVFTCYKFRTMRPSHNAEVQQCVANDTRITPVGKLLRATHVDELPQLVNILLGDMSFVGPRPHMLYHDQLYNRMMPDYYHHRHDVLPGLTGLAQAHGYHGTITDYYSIYHRTRLDLFYMQRSSFALDVSILFRTINNLIFPGK